MVCPKKKLRSAGLFPQRPEKRLEELQASESEHQKALNMKKRNSHPKMNNGSIMEHPRTCQNRSKVAFRCIRACSLYVQQKTAVGEAL